MRYPQHPSLSALLTTYSVSACVNHLQSVKSTAFRLNGRMLFCPETETKTRASNAELRLLRFMAVEMADAGNFGAL
ncbi:hypothetical protein KCP71_21955 [Salmonella enterica subsp. enterica]|nr:hypothetical protein KCP71_21955 [Salmonella enterica subsp. enterica]